MKKINLFNDSDRFIFNKTFRYNVIVMIVLLIIMVLLLLLEKNQYYENQITFMDDKMAFLVVDNKYLNTVKEKKELILDKVSYKYNIEKIEEVGEIYFVYINFDIKLKVNERYYKIFIGKEKLVQYFIRIVKDIK